MPSYEKLTQINSLHLQHNKEKPTQNYIFILYQSRLDQFSIPEGHPKMNKLIIKISKNFLTNCFQINS